MKLSEKLPEIIALAKAADDHWQREFDKLGTFPSEEDDPLLPERVRLKELLSSLSQEQLFAIVTIAYLGQGPKRVEEIDAYRRRMVERWAGARLPDILVDTATLADELTDGLEKLAAKGIQIDSVVKPIPELAA